MELILSLPTLQGYGAHAPALTSRPNQLHLFREVTFMAESLFLCSPINIVETPIMSQDTSCVSFPYWTLWTHGTAAISSFLNIPGLEYVVLYIHSQIMHILWIASAYHRAWQTVILQYIVQQIVKSALKLFRTKQFDVLIQIVKVLDWKKLQFPSITCKSRWSLLS